MKIVHRGHIYEEVTTDRKYGKLLSELKPNIKSILMFRARDANDSYFVPYDYVTLSHKFAIEHAESNHAYTEDPQIVIRALVPAKYLAEASNPGEWFYIGPKIKGSIVYKTLGVEEYEGNIPDLRYSKTLNEEVINGSEYDIEKIKRDPNYDYKNYDGVMYRITRNTDVEPTSINRIAMTDDNEFYEAQIQKYVDYIKNGGIIEPFPVEVSKLENNLQDMLDFLDRNDEYDGEIDEAFHDVLSNKDLGIRRYRFLDILSDIDEGELFYKWRRLNPRAISLNYCFPKDITAEEKELIPFLTEVFKFFTDNEEYTLINQNHRFEALKRLGKTHVLIRK